MADKFKFIQISKNFSKLRLMADEKKYEIEENSLIMKEPEPDFEKAEEDLLRTALKRSYKERFLVMTNLMKDSMMMKKAKITYKYTPLPISRLREKDGNTQ